jgi:hypothetical protein
VPTTLEPTPQPTNETTTTTTASEDDYSGEEDGSLIDEGTDADKPFQTAGSSERELDAWAKEHRPVKAHRVAAPPLVTTAAVVWD